MLPFLKPEKMAQMIMSRHNSETGGVEDMHGEGDMHPGLMSAAEDLIRAVHDKDSKAVAMALEDAFEVCDTYSDNEGDDEDEPAGA